MFKKLAYFTDIHYGRSNGNVDFLEDCDRFVDWFIAEAKARGCETFIFGGDFFDNRFTIQLNTLHHALDALQKLSDAFEAGYILMGNHDLFFRDRRDISSVEVARNLKNLTIIREPTVKGDVAFLPWLVKDEHKSLKIDRSRYVFGHLELPGFLMNARVEMPDSGHLKAPTFKENEYVFTGHFHMRQIRDNIVYTGNVMPFNFSDNWDAARGAMFMEWGGEPTFLSWPDQPLFRTMTLSQLIADPERFLCPKVTARISLDVDISFEEAQAIKETFLTDFRARKIELIPAAKPEAEASLGEAIVYQTVDQIVVDGLTAIESNDLDVAKLVQIYQGLAIE